jgi:glycosyltransferase involved in cell wall biosynthesis
MSVVEAGDEFVIIMPTYNEVGQIATTVAEAKRHLPVVVIDDGSTDGSGDLAEAAGATVIRHSVNQGKGAALRTGFDYALRLGVSAAIAMDGDGQHDPAEIPRFIEAYRRGAGDLIIGQRTFTQMPIVRRIANRIGNLLLSAAMGQKVLDNQSGYRLIGRPILEGIRPTATGFEAEVEILLRAQLANFRIGWVPIRTIYGAEVSHFRPLRDTSLFLKMVWRVWRARRRGHF